MSKIKWFTCSLVVFFLILTNSLYHWWRGPIEAELAVKQAEDSALAYGASRALSEGHGVLTLLNVFGVLIILVLAVPTLVRLINNK